MNHINWSESEWNTILKIFGMEEAERIAISDYTFEAFGTEKNNVTDDQWKEAIDYLNQLIVEYATIGWARRFSLDAVLVPLKKRYENGERTKELYDEIMRCE